MECNGFRDEMMDVLYGEADPATRRRFDEHQAACPACRQEIAGLRRLRRGLAAWSLPPALHARRGRANRARRALPVAAGVVLALGAALGLSGSELSYREGRVALRLGRASAAVPDRTVNERIAALEARHRAEMEVLRADLARAKDESEAVVLARVSEMIRGSEARQAVLVGASMASLRDENDAKRRYDLAQVGAGLSYLEGKTGLQAARTTELMGHVLQAAQKR
jgi:hypothetical protein